MSPSVSPFVRQAGRQAGRQALSRQKVLSAAPQSLPRSHPWLRPLLAHLQVIGSLHPDGASHYEKLKGQEGLLSPDAIADNYLHLHKQPPCAWTHELDLRPYCEKW